MSKLVSLSIAIIVTLLSTVGCSANKHSISDNPKLGWINEVNASGNHYWIVTNIKVTPDQPIGHIGLDTLGGQIDANVLPSGTPLYTIKGQDQTKVIAVALDNGQQGYVEAVNAGSNKPK